MTSGTLFAYHKLPLQRYLAAIVIYSNAVKGLSALQLGRDLGVLYKTAFVLMHKLSRASWTSAMRRRWRARSRSTGALSGGSVDPANQAEERVDQRLGEHNNPDKRCVLVVRETFPADDLAERIGGKRTLAFIIGQENQAAVGTLAARFIAPGTLIAADGTTNNQAESYLSRIRGMQLGQHHHFSLAPLAN